MDSTKDEWRMRTFLLLFAAVVARTDSLQQQSYITRHHRHTTQRSFCRNIFIVKTHPSSSSTPTTTIKTSSTNDDKRIDGKAIAAEIQQELQQEIQQLQQQHDTTPPGLAVILVGDRRESQTYVRMKQKACDNVGIESFLCSFQEDDDESEVLQLIHDLNERKDVHGILVQLPLPSHWNERRMLESVDPTKDVDGLHPINMAKLVVMTPQQQSSSTAIDWHNLKDLPFSVPCTPLGCLELLDRSGVELAGTKAVVIGRSNLVGLPVSLLLMHRDATVTMVHSKTQNIQQEVARAKVVIVAVGKAHLVKKDWLRPGAVVIDVGINSVDILPAEQERAGGKQQRQRRSYKLVGDVDYQDCLETCSKLTPVPGGVGPMTIAMLLRNTVNAYKRTLSIKSDDNDDD